MDVLADLLARARARGAVFSVSTLRAPWGIDFAENEPLSLHPVLEGELWIETEGRPPERVMQGDVILMRGVRPYRFVHAPGAECVPLRSLVGPRELSFGGDGPVTRLACGAYVFEGSICASLLDVLPPMIVLRNAQDDPSLRSALSLLTDEIVRTEAGQQTVLDRLLDLLLVYSLRAWFSRPESEAPAWYTALGDPVAGPALRAIHDEPARPWTVAELAGLAGLSRAAFARRFAAATGQAPLTYVTNWRMTIAAQALTTPDATLASVAAEVGYANEFAFAAAFKRHFGEPPGRFRRQLALRPAS